MVLISHCTSLYDDFFQNVLLNYTLHQRNRWKILHVPVSRNFEDTAIRFICCLKNESSALLRFLTLFSVEMGKIHMTFKHYPDLCKGQLSGVLRKTYLYLVSRLLNLPYYVAATQRRQLIRYISTATIFVNRPFSALTRKRFPTVQHMVDAGFLTKGILQYSTFCILCYVYSIFYEA